MVENFDQGVIEAEILLLSQEIEAKRRQLETNSGVIVQETEGKAELRGTNSSEKITETISNVPSNTQITDSASPSATSRARKPTSGSYLDGLDDESVDRVNSLIDAAFSHGLNAAISKAREQSPYLMDAFHDALTDKLYEELKSRKLIK